MHLVYGTADHEGRAHICCKLNVTPGGKLPATFSLHTYTRDFPTMDYLRGTKERGGRSPQELAEVLQHDVARIRLMSEVVLEVIDTMNPAAEVSKFRRVLLEPLCSNSGRVGCRIVLLRLPKIFGMHYNHEWVQVIRQDVYVDISRRLSTVVSRRIRGHISRQLRTPHTITEPEHPPALIVNIKGLWIHEGVSIPVQVHQVN
ncbi:hypothetical protein TNCV_692641 [Trichonephila clavipes]|nr:hypothetical protein TNCV_692641 [Trichonephila clavipes]